MSQRALGMIAVCEAAVIAVLLVLLLQRDAPAPVPESAERDAGDGGAGAPARRPAADDDDVPRLSGGTEARSPAGGASRIDIAPGDPIRILVYGSMRTPDGAPVANGVVSLRDADGTRRFADGDGTYAFTGVSPGTWTVGCSADGYLAPDEQTITLAEGTAARRMDFVLRKAWRIHVWIETPEGESFLAEAGKRGLPVDRLAVVATKAPPSGNLPRIASFDYRRYGIGHWTVATPWDQRAMEALPPGARGYVDLDGAPPVHLSLILQHIVLATVEVAAGVDEARFVLPVEALADETATVKVRAVDAETGEPIRSAHVTFGSTMTTIGKNGERTLTHLAPGEMAFGIDAPGHATYRTRLRLEAGREHDLGTLRLPKGRTIRGRVVDETGKPLQGRIQWRDPALMAFPQPLRTNRTWVMDDRGRFEIPSAGPVEGWLLVGVDERPAVTFPVDGRHGDVDGLEIVVPKGTRVTLRPRATPDTHHLLTVRDEAGLPLWTGVVTGAWPITTHLVPGRYTLEIVRNDRIEKRIPLVVEGTPLEIAVE